jgi:hypothetical protein
VASVRVDGERSRPDGPVAGLLLADQEIGEVHTEGDGDRRRFDERQVGASSVLVVRQDRPGQVYALGGNRFGEVLPGEPLLLPEPLHSRPHPVFSLR